jgi:hypothetical protein
MTETSERMVGTTVNEDLQAYRSKGIDERTWDTQHAPLVCRGYPKLTEERARLIAQLQGVGDVVYEKDKRLRRVIRDSVEVLNGSELVGD